MRVISGTAKNKVLLVPEEGTRPLTDRIKMSLFDLLQPYLKDATVLDLFAGSGGFGIEALSRGAKSAAFVDHGDESVDLIKHNLANTGFTDQGIIIKNSVVAYLEDLSDKFNIIFLDPPFKMEQEIVASLVAKAAQATSEDGVLIVRQPYENGQADTLPALEGLEQVYQKRYGKSLISFYRR